MGRIADALKRAEQERSVSVAESIGHIGMQTAEPVGIASVVVTKPGPTDDEANEPEPRVAVVGGLS